MVVRSSTVAPGEVSEEALARAAALAEHSRHPVSRALVQMVRTGQTASAARWQVRNVVEVAGMGLQGEVADVLQSPLAWRRMRLGSPRDGSVLLADAEMAGSRVVLAQEEGDGAWRELACFALSESVRPDAAAVVQALQSEGVTVHLLSGDRKAAADAVAQAVGIDEVRADCRPQDKLAVLRQWQSEGRTVAMVGDGLNDGPILAGAHVSFAFGRAVPLAQAQSDFVVLGDRLERIVQAVSLARRTLRTIRQNLGWAAAYNVVAVPLAWIGWMPAWLAGLGMAFSSLWVVLNSARLARHVPGVGAKSWSQPGDKPAVTMPVVAKEM